MISKKTKTTAKKTKPKEIDSVELINKLENQLVEAQEKEKRVLADYQNLARRTREDRLKLVKLANKDLILSLLQPLQHLEMASQQLKDNGLEMVLQQFQRAMSEFGVKEIEALGKEFDVETMEAIETEGDRKIVQKVTQKGYTLNGEVIQHAKVILG